MRVNHGWLVMDLYDHYYYSRLEVIFLTAKEAMDALEALLNEPNVTTSMIDDILEDVPVIDTNRYT